MSDEGKFLNAGGGEGAAEQGGGSTNPWDAPITSVLPEELHADPLATKYKSIKAFFEGAKATSTYVGKQQEGMVKLPSAESTPEEVEEYYNKLRPESSDKYDFNVEEGIARNEKREGWFKELAHKVGLTNQQANDFLNEYYKQSASEQSEGIKEAQQELLKAWGTKFDINLKRANVALNTLPPEMQKIIDEKYGYDPVVTQMLHAFGERLGEDQIIITDGGDGGNTTFADTQAKIDEINNKLRTNPNYQERERLLGEKKNLLNVMTKFHTG